MPARRWLQFSLRFLIAMMVAAALVAWRYRPGVIRPQFSFDGFEQATDSRANPIVVARVRLTNEGPDPIFIDGQYRYTFDPRYPRGALEESMIFEFRGGGAVSEP